MMTIQERASRMAMAVTAAQEMHSAKLGEYLATIKVASAPQRELARVNAMAAYEALLDLYDRQIVLIHEIQSIDPRFREGS